MPTKSAFWTKNWFILPLTYLLLVEYPGQLSAAHSANHIVGVSVDKRVLDIEVVVCFAFSWSYQ